MLVLALPCASFGDAKNVILTGDFIDWNEGELKMVRKDDGWELPYVLGPGNYEYKFIVDGKWITDPDNPIVKGLEQWANSVVAVEPNVTFHLDGFADAERVLLSENLMVGQKKDIRWFKKVTAGRSIYI